MPENEVIPSQLRSSPSLSLFRENTKEYFDRADRQPVTIRRDNKMYILISHAQYVAIVNGSRGNQAIHTVVTIVQRT
jgi:hypothetical protein